MVLKLLVTFYKRMDFFFKRDAFAQRFHLPHVCTMQYNSTICAISMLFKKYSIHRAAAIKRECTFFVPFYFDFILLKEKCTKDIYRCLNNIEVIPTSINKWNTVLSTYLSNNICVTDIFLKFASKPPQFQLYSGYEIEFHIEFYQLTII